MDKSDKAILALYYHYKYKLSPACKSITKAAKKVKEKYNMSDEEFNKKCVECYEEILREYNL